MTASQIIRVAFGYLFLSCLQIGAWALFAPRSFYDGFPGAGRSWVSVDGPYNEHLVRDVGALNLAIAVLLLWAAITLVRPLISAAAVATLVWGLPHLTYHAFNTDGLDRIDVAANLTGLAIFAALPVAALLAARRLPLATPSTERAAVGS